MWRIRGEVARSARSLRIPSLGWSPTHPTLCDMQARQSPALAYKINGRHLIVRVPPAFFALQGRCPVHVMVHVGKRPCIVR